MNYAIASSYPEWALLLVDNLTKETSQNERIYVVATFCHHGAIPQDKKIMS